MTKNLFEQAKKNKADEFYTQLPDIEAEMRHYKEQYKQPTNVYRRCASTPVEVPTIATRSSPQADYAIQAVTDLGRTVAALNKRIDDQQQKERKPDDYARRGGGFDIPLLYCNNIFSFPTNQLIRRLIYALELSIYDSRRKSYSSERRGPT